MYTLLQLIDSNVYNALREYFVNKTCKTTYSNSEIRCK